MASVQQERSNNMKVIETKKEIVPRIVTLKLSNAEINTIALCLSRLSDKTLQELVNSSNLDIKHCSGGFGLYDSFLEISDIDK